MVAAAAAVSFAGLSACSQNFRPAADLILTHIWSLWPLFAIGTEPDVGEGRVLMSAIPRPELRLLQLVQAYQ